MTDAIMKIEKFDVCNSVVDIAVSFTTESRVSTPRIAIIFSSESGENRRLPMKTETNGAQIIASGKYDASQVFYGTVCDTVSVSFVFSDGRDNGKLFESGLTVDGIKRKSAFIQFFKESKSEKVKTLVSIFLSVLSLPFRALKIKKNRIAFISNRSNTPSGNLNAVYKCVSDIQNADIRVLCKKGGAKETLSILFKFLYLYMTSGIVFIDDYYHLISYVKKKKGTKLIQLWHGCGAFKTFGYSRYHKDSALEIYSANHRQYDFAIVSSPDVCDLYAEAFGISSQKVLPLGSPRCDILANEEYKAKKRAEFFGEFPLLQGKRLLLFAPTFRGKGNGDCFYPLEKFNVDRVLDTLGEEWAIIIKLHPYLEEKISFSEKNKDRVANCEKWDINDVLFSTDYLVTDYSSVIFEASLLEIPMVFLAFDLEEYIEKRDFYYNFTDFIPGPTVKTDIEAAEIAKSGNYDTEKIKAFAHKAFGDTAGNACSNIKELTLKLLRE